MSLVYITGAQVSRAAALKKEDRMVAATGERVKNQILEEWASTPDASAREVSRRFLHIYGKALVGDRTIQTIVGEAKRAAPAQPFPCTLWRPWSDPAINLDDTFFLLKLHQHKRKGEGVGLTCPEAKWATLLRSALEGLKTWQVLELVRAYVARERTAYYLNAPIYTEDLDSFVASQMWLDDEHQRQYEELIAAGAAPVPFLNASEEFLKELVAQGPAGLGEETWDRLSHHLIFAHTFKLLANPSEPLPAGWSDILLDFLDDPTSFDALLSPTTAATSSAHS
jgi:hypothetical protein